MRLLALLLFWLNVIFYVVLILGTVARLIFFLPRFVSDLSDAGRGTGFLTMVAGTCMLGNQCVLLGGRLLAARYLWYAALLLWFFLLYGLLSAVILRRDKPAPEKGIQGGWLLVVVATQSVSTLSTLIHQSFAASRESVLLAALLFFLLGCVLYLIIIAGIFFRLVFLNLSPEMLTPPFWITMGAAAITALAGALLMTNGLEWSFIADILPFLKGFTLCFWIAGSWWIPLLIILFLWRHTDRRFPLHYEPAWWSMVFTLGMYTTCSSVLGGALRLKLLPFISHWFFYMAICAWLLVFLAMVFSLLKGLTAR